MEHYGAGPIFYNFGSDMASALDMMEIDAPQRKPRTIVEVLPEAMLMEILSRVGDAKELARCAAVNRSFRSSFSQVRSVRFICRLQEHMDKKKNPFSPSGDRTPFKDAVICTLGKLKGVENLRLEIEDEMQTKRFKDDELDKNSLWLSERSFVSKWLPPVSKTLQSLCVVDYGQQAIFKSSPLLQTLSINCPNLRSLELRNMFIDCRDCKVMKKMKGLTLRCVKLTDAGLKDISKCMPDLDILTLVTVVGLKEAEFKSETLKVLCLGLATKVTSVKLDVSSLIKLQLKMACPETLQVRAPDLKSLALCMGQNRILEFKAVSQLRELLMGAAEFSTLKTLTAANGLLEKVFLDIPCMEFDESGAWKRVKPQVPLNVPDMEAIRESCTDLQTLSLGPGLWHSFEQGMTKRDADGSISLPKWPTLRRLMLHIVVLNSDTTLGLLRALMRAVPTLSILEVYVHASSKIGKEEFRQSLEVFCPHLDLKFGGWKKGLKFGCFSF